MPGPASLCHPLSISQLISNEFVYIYFYYHGNSVQHLRESVRDRPSPEIGIDFHTVSNAFVKSRKTEKVHIRNCCRRVKLRCQETDSITTSTIQFE